MRIETVSSDASNSTWRYRTRLDLPRPTSPRMTVRPCRWSTVNLTRKSTASSAGVKYKLFGLGEIENGVLKPGFFLAVPVIEAAYSTSFGRRQTLFAPAGRKLSFIFTAAQKLTVILLPGSMTGITCLVL